MQWDWDYAFQILPGLSRAAITTVAAALLGYAIALVGGLLFLAVQRAPVRIVARIGREAAEFIRSTPLIVQVFFIYYVGPEVGISLSAWNSGLLAIGLHYSAYLSEIYRSGLSTVPAAQYEACTALNFRLIHRYRRIIIPQAFPACLPGMANYLIGIFKDTPILSVIGVGELVQTASEYGTLSYRYFEPYTIVGILFLLFSLPASLGMRALERRYGTIDGIRK